MVSLRKVVNTTEREHTLLYEVGKVWRSIRCASKGKERLRRGTSTKKKNPKTNIPKTATKKGSRWFYYDLLGDQRTNKGLEKPQESY